eukprot:UN34581
MICFVWSGFVVRWLFYYLRFLWYDIFICVFRMIRIRSYMFSFTSLGVCSLKGGVYLCRSLIKLESSGEVLFFTKLRRERVIIR